jgi:hypothetical protein
MAHWYNEEDFRKLKEQIYAVDVVDVKLLVRSPLASTIMVHRVRRSLNPTEKNVTKKLKPEYPTGDSCAPAPGHNGHRRPAAITSWLVGHRAQTFLQAQCPLVQKMETAIVSTSQRLLLSSFIPYLTMLVLVPFSIVLYNHISSASYIIAPVIEIQVSRTA